MAPPRVKISDPAELADMQMRKRKEFEDNIRKNWSRMANWTKYAAWEETQEYDRARLGERGKWSGRKRSDLKSNRDDCRENGTVKPNSNKQNNRV